MVAVDTRQDETRVPLEQTWSNTQFDKFTQCPRRYYYTYVLGKKRLDPAGLSAQFSSMVIHPMLAGMYMGESDEKVTEDVKEHYYDFEQCGGITVVMSANYSMDVVEKIRSLYEDIIRKDREEYNILYAEERHVVYLDEVGVIVKPDVVLAHKKTHKVIPLDFKVSGYDRPGNRLQHHTQFVGQAVATNADSVIVDSITVSKGGKVSVGRDEVFISDELKQEWMEEMYSSILTRNCCVASGVWPKRSAACYDYNNPCPFIAACSQGRTFGEKLL